MQDWPLFEKHAHFNRERIPERVVHAKGSGAYGVLTVTHDITQYTRAKIFSKLGSETECFLRFVLPLAPQALLQEHVDRKAAAASRDVGTAATPAIRNT